MKYGLIFKVDLYDAEKEQPRELLTMPGDYIRMCEWADEHLAGAKGGMALENMRRNYAVTWFAIKRRGKLAEYGMPEELTVDSITSIADRFSIYVEEVEDDSLPLARVPGK